MNPNTYAAKRVSEKLAKLISNSLSYSEQRIYNLAEQADALSFDALYLWVLKEKFGFTIEMLLQLFGEVSSEAEKYRNYPLSGSCIPLVGKLKAAGVDLETISQEKSIWQ